MAGRTFIGGRTGAGGGRSVASELMRIEMQKKGKFTAKERYSRIFKAKLAENNKKATTRKGGLSKTADKAMKQIAAKKAAKEAKALRRMVMVTPQRFSNGRVTDKGKILDIQDNVVGQIDRKTGKMSTTMGWGIGKYKPRNYMTSMAIQSAINQYSPYFIQQRKNATGQGGFDPMTYGLGNQQETINHYGRQAGLVAPPIDHGSNFFAEPASNYFDDGGRSGVGGMSAGVTAWGATSNNVWGTMSDNTWGTTADNVWGGAESNVWGGVNDAGNLFKWRSPQVWNTGSGRNYIKGLSALVAAFFGLGKKNANANAQRLASIRTGGGSTSGSGPSRSGPSTSGPRSSAPSGPRPSAPARPTGRR